MTTPHAARALLYTSAFTLAALPAFAQSPAEVADRLTELLKGEGAAAATYNAADEADGAVEITGLTVETQEGEGTDTFSAETTRLTDAELSSEGGIKASGIVVENARLVSTNWGEATAERGEGSGIALAPKGAEGATDNAPSAVEMGTLTNITVDPTESDAFTIASISFEQGDYVDSVATRRSFTVQDIVLGRGDFGAESDELFDYLGVDEITVDVSGSGNWTPESGTFEISEARISGDEIGTMAMSITLGGVTQNTFDQLEANPMQALTPLTLANLKIDLETGPLVDQAIEIRAETMGVSTDDLRTTAVVTSKQMLVALGDSPFRASFETALEQFIEGDSNTLSITAAPQTPIPVLAVGMTAQAAPTSLPELLNLSVE